MAKKFPLTREEKERKVIELLERGMNVRDMAKRVHLSFSDICEITRKRSGDKSTTERSKSIANTVRHWSYFKEEIQI
jgi:hypothetical protein